MLFAIKDREDLEKIEDLGSLKNQMEERRLKDKLGTRIFHESPKKLHDSLTDTIKTTSENLTKFNTETLTTEQ